jgi:hypothetical protein
MDAHGWQVHLQVLLVFTGLLASYNKARLMPLGSLTHGRQMTTIKGMPNMRGKIIHAHFYTINSGSSVCTPSEFRPFSLPSSAQQNYSVKWWSWCPLVYKHGRMKQEIQILKHVPCSIYIYIIYIYTVHMDFPSHYDMSCSWMVWPSKLCISNYIYTGLSQTFLGGYRTSLSHRIQLPKKTCRGMSQILRDTIHNKEVPIKVIILIVRHTLKLAIQRFIRSWVAMT